MDPVTMLIDALTNRIPEYGLLALLGLVMAYLWVQARDDKKNNMSQAESFSRQLKETAEAVAKCQIDHSTATNALTAQISAFQIAIARDTPTRREMLEAIKTSQDNFLEIVEPMKDDIKWVRDVLTKNMKSP